MYDNLPTKHNVILNVSQYHISIARVKWCPIHIVFSCLRLVYTMLPVSLDCPFLIALVVLSNVYHIVQFALNGTSISLIFPINEEYV
jgi:hypothetical protein